MCDVETFLIEVYVCFTEECEPALPPAPVRPGTALTRGEVVCLALLRQWRRFPSERDFYRWASEHLRSLFPRLPVRTQFNRALRREEPTLTQFALYLAAALRPEAPTYEILDSTGVPVRNRRRPGHGWLPEVADIGYSPRLGQYEGCHLLVCTRPDGVLTGWGLGPASANDRALADTLLALRQAPDPFLASAGTADSGWYVADSGFAGVAHEAFWHAYDQAIVVCAPQTGSIRAVTGWSPLWGAWLARRRQQGESVIGRLPDWFGLARERPHKLTGLLARPAAKAALHNFCIWWNRQHDQSDLQIADLIQW